jgi:hypothetical protein
VNGGSLAAMNVVGNVLWTHELRVWGAPA